MRVRKQFLELVVCFLVCSLSASAQQDENGPSPLAQLVAESKAATRITQSFKPFTKATVNARRTAVDAILKDVSYLTLSATETRQLWQKRPGYLELSLPTSTGAELALELAMLSPLETSFFVTTSESNGQPVPYEPGAYYRGVIRGVPGSVVALSVFQDEIIAVASTPDKGNFVLGRLNEPGNQTGYILYSDKELPPPQGTICGTTEPIGYTEKVREYLQESANKTTSTKCVRVFLECD
ncbi:MAG: hypothetical protein EOP49_24660, partial [Sphingobacteriales bacterium]